MMATVIAERPSIKAYMHRRAVNWSTLSEMQKSPLAYQHRLTTPRESTPAMDLGRLVHTAVLEPERLETDYAVWSGGRRGTNEYKEWVLENAGREVTTVTDFEKAQAIAAAVWAHKAARRVLRGGRTEQTLTWTDPVTHLRCKGRVDHIRGGALSDLKTTRTVEPRAFGRSVESFGSHAQMAFYRRGMAASGYPDGPTRLIAVEQEPPHEVAVYVVPEEVLFAGDLIVGKLLHEVRLWRSRRRWPVRYEEETTLDFPSWALASDSDYSNEIEVLP